MQQPIVEWTADGGKWFPADMSGPPPELLAAIDKHRRCDKPDQWGELGFGSIAYRFRFHGLADAVRAGLDMGAGSINTVDRRPEPPTSPGPRPFWASAQRDAIAIAAMPTFIEIVQRTLPPSASAGVALAKVAEHCYDLADAMLKQREVAPKPSEL